MHLVKHVTKTNGIYSIHKTSPQYLFWKKKIHWIIVMVILSFDNEITIILVMFRIYYTVISFIMITSWKQDVNWPYITSYVRSIYVTCPGEMLFHYSAVLIRPVFKTSQRIKLFFWPSFSFSWVFDVKW